MEQQEAISEANPKSTKEQLTSFLGKFPNPKDLIEKLKAMKLLLDEKNIFNEGDIVTWKDGLKNKQIPDYGDFGIVVKVLETPVIDTEDLSSTYYNERLDIQIGFITANGDFITFIHDSRRFRTV